jgi:CheY-like chemotaxis protein
MAGRISREFPGTIHAILSDVRMPKVNGLELRERILKEDFNEAGIEVVLAHRPPDEKP